MAVAHCGLFKLGRVMEHRRLADMRPPGLFHRGYLLWLRQVKHPQTPPPWVAEALGVSPAPGPGMVMTPPWPSQPLPGHSGCWGGAPTYTRVRMHVRVCMAHMYTPPTCTLRPTCAHAHFLRHTSGCTLR